MSAPARTALPRLLVETGTVAVLRARHAAEYAPVVEALARGGVRSIELTLSTSGVFEELGPLRERLGTDVELGVGTVTTADEARQAIESGAVYLVTPVTEPAVIDVAVAAGVPILPGGLSPTELHTGWRLGAAAVKLFPASTVGPSYLGQLRGPFPELRVMPSGGVSIDDAAGWIRAGAVGVSLGGPLVRDAFDGGSLAELEERASRLVAVVSEARAG